MKSFFLSSLGVLFLGHLATIGVVGAEKVPAPKSANEIQLTTAAPSETSKTKVDISWENKKATLDVIDADVQSVLKSLSDKSGVEIKIFEGVSGKVTMRLEKVPLEKAVDNLLAAVGQRNYIMVFDGGGLTKMTIVPKGKGGPGAGTTDEVKRVKVKGKLMNGEEIEYYPGEVWVLYGGIPPSQAYLDERIKNIESYKALAFMKKVVLHGQTLLKFRVLNGRDALQIMRGTGGGFATVNGLGPNSTELPEEDFHIADLTWSEEEKLALRERRADRDALAMRKNSFLKKGDIYNVGIDDYRYVEGELQIVIYGSDPTFITSDDVMKLVHDEGGILYAQHGGAGGLIYDAFFPGLKTTEQHVAMIKRLKSSALFKRAKNPTTGVTHNPWGWHNSSPSDTRYAEQWYLEKIRAEYAWETETGSETITVGILDTGITHNHEEFQGAGKIHALSADFMYEPYRISGAAMVDYDQNSYHGTHVAGICAARRNNDRGIAGVAGGDGASNQGVSILAVAVDNQAYNRWRSIQYSRGLGGGINYYPGPAGSFPIETFVDPNSLNQWSFELPWGITNKTSYTGDYSLTDSPNGEAQIDYANNANIKFTSGEIGLSGYASKPVRLSFWSKSVLAPSDYLFVEASNDGAAWDELARLEGMSDWRFIVAEIPAKFRTPTFRFRFRLQTDASGTADGVYIDDIGIGYPLANVLNLSWSIDDNPKYVYDAAVGAFDDGIAVIAAAGNKDTETTILGEVCDQVCLEKILFVAASDEDDKRWDENRTMIQNGSGSSFGTFVDVSAPGHNILSTVGGGTNNYLPDSGTSMAAPQVAGLTALILSKFPGMTPGEVYQRIITTADTTLNLAANEVGRMGSGRINMYSALRGARDSQPPPGPTDGMLIPEEGSIRVTWTATDNDAIGECLLYRRSSSGVSCTDPVTIGGQNYCLVAQVRSANSFFTHTDEPLAITDRFYYRIIAVDKTGNKSLPTAELGPTAAHLLPPAAPYAVNARGGNGTAKLTWTAVTLNADGSELDDLAGYRVSYGLNATFAGAAQVETTATSVDLVLTNDKVYFVRVTALDLVGNESAPSDIVTVKPRGGSYVRWVHPPGTGPAGSYTTIGAALANAPIGTTVIVGAGTYFESDLKIGFVSSYGDRVTLRSEHGPGRTIIDGGSAGLILDVGKMCRVIGFTLRHRDRAGTGIRAVFAHGALIANNIFDSHHTGIDLTAGIHWEPKQIFNNVFLGNVVGMYGAYNLNAQIRNNIFAGNVIAVQLFSMNTASLYYNAYLDNRTKLETIRDNTIVNRNEVSCGSSPFVNVYSSPPDLHLEPGSCAVNAASRFVSWDPIDGRSREWRECLSSKSMTDLGAYGGPFAVIDNNGDGIPDCDLPGGYATAVAMLMDSAGQPVPLQYRNPALADPGFDDDPLGDPPAPDAGLTFTIVSPPAHGTLSGTAPDLLYTPDPGFVGEDGFGFTVSNEIGTSEPATVSITVKAANTPPVALEQSILQIPISQSGTDLVLQGTDADGDPLSFTIDTQPATGRLECPYPPECSFVSELYQPASFTYHVNDGIADSPPATVTLTVNVEPTIALLTPAAGEPATNAHTFTLTWQDADPDSGALIDFYLDTDGAGHDGVPIAYGIPEDDPADSLELFTYYLPDGAYYIYAVIQDQWSSAAAYAPGPLVIDRTPPKVTVEPAGGIYREPQTVVLTVNEPATIHVTTDGTAPDLSSPPYAGAIPVSAELTLRWIAVDAAGNQGAEGRADYVIDGQPPWVSIDPPPDPLRQNYVTLSGSMEAGASVTVAVDQPAVVGWVWYPVATAWICDLYGLTGGPATFTATAEDAAGNTASAQATTTVNLNQAPGISSIGDQTVGEGELLSFAVCAWDPDGTTPTVGAAPLPPGATFDGTTFSWQPEFGAAGSYPVTFTANDGDLSGSERVTITVLHTNRAPTVPVLLAPVTRSEVPELQPVLEVENSADADRDALSYEFEVYGDAGLYWPLLASGAIPEGSPTTAWRLPGEQPDNSWYWWRARAVDGLSASAWTEAASFFVNLANEPPGAFALSEPQPNAAVATTTPALGVSNSVDPDGDAVSYAFLVASDAEMSSPVASVAGLPAGAEGITTWTVDPPLNDNSRYHWQAVATDEHGASTRTGTSAFFVNLANEAPSAPVISAPADGEEVPAVETSLTVVNAVDPDYDPLWYYFELDTVATFDGPGKVFSEAIAEGGGWTFWPLAGLSDNTWYHWRVRANDGLADSPWGTGRFFTNTANDPPAAVVALNPGAGAWVDSVKPWLEISASADPDGDQLRYAYRIYAQPPGAPLAEGQSPETTWISNQALPDNAWYLWQARAVDEHGLAGPWSEPTAFFVNNNGIDDPPSLTLIEPAAATVTSGAPVTIAWADGDPDSDAQIALYRDSDGVGADGVLIADGIAEDPDGAGDQYQWDLADVPSGTWRIYGVIRDATSERASYAPGSVTIDRQAPSTSLSPTPGTYAGAVTVTMIAVDDRDPSPAIYYTTDGSEPSVRSTRYTGPIALTQTTTLRYFAVDDAGLEQSPKGSAVYTIQVQVAVVAPNGGEVIASGSTYTIRWGAPSNATRFDLAYSTNNGGSYTNIATGRTGSSYAWAVPKPTANSTQCRVRVIGKTASGGTVGTDASDQVFTIEVVRVSTPNGGEVYTRAATPTRQIAWVTNGTSQTVNKVTLSYSTNGGGAWTKIADLTTNPGTYTWTLPATNGSQYRVKVDLYRSSTLLGSDTSNGNFTVGP